MSRRNIRVLLITFLLYPVIWLLLFILFYIIYHKDAQNMVRGFLEPAITLSLMTVIYMLVIPLILAGSCIFYWKKKNEIKFNHSLLMLIVSIFWGLVLFVALSRYGLLEKLIELADQFLH